MLKDLLARKAEIEQRMAALQEEMAAVQCDIEHAVAAKLQELRQLQGKDTGTVNLLFEGFKVSETVPKKVEWDQDKMRDTFKAIQTAGDDPFNYMRVKFEIAEKQFEQFIPEVKAIFQDCRTVKPGKAQLKFEEVQ